MSNQKGTYKIKAMISQPLGGKTPDEIREDRERAISFLTEQGFEIINTLYDSDWYSDTAFEERGVINKPVSYLAKSVEQLATVHVCYFVKGWDNARGCRLENRICQDYGIQTMYEN